MILDIDEWTIRIIDDDKRLTRTDQEAVSHMIFIAFLTFIVYYVSKPHAAWFELQINPRFMWIVHNKMSSIAAYSLSLSRHKLSFKKKKQIMDIT
jgi:hypothetical protein